MMKTIQELIDEGTGEKITLAAGEYKGPLHVRRPCRIDGSGATVWADSGPVVVLEADGVQLENMRIEVVRPKTEEDNIALFVRGRNCRIAQVELHGAHEAADGSAAPWHLPESVDLGRFAAERENSFVIELEAGADAAVESSIGGAKITPQQVKKGRNRLLLTLPEMRRETLVYGDILVRTPEILRRICVTGEADERAAQHLESLALPEAANASLAAKEAAFEMPGHIPSAGGGAGLAASPPVPPERSGGEKPQAAARRERAGTAVTAVRGQRMALGNADCLEFVYEDQGHAAGVDLDAYVFCLSAAGKVRGDEDLVFFGNPEAADKSVRVEKPGQEPRAVIDMAKLAAGIDRLVLCFSIYEEDKSAQDFSAVRQPAVRVLNHGEEKCFFPLDGLRAEKTVNAAEIYRYKGEWKLKFVGAGYASGLERLCRDYGINVE